MCEEHGLRVFARKWPLFTAFFFPLLPVKKEKRPGPIYDLAANVTKQTSDPLIGPSLSPFNSNRRKIIKLIFGEFFFFKKLNLKVPQLNR